MRRILLVLATLPLAGPAGAGSGLYRCEATDGSLHFADSVHACRGAAPHRVEPPREHRVQRVGPPAAASQPDATRRPPRDLEALLPDAEQAGSGFEVVREGALDPSRDPDLVEWGVVDRRARHYTRQRGGATEVCSIELWSFRTLEQASAAGAGFAYPDWQISREGEILLMLRGLRRSPGAPPERGVFADCAALGEQVRARLRTRAGGRSR